MVGFYNYTVILTYLGVVSAVLGIGLSMYGRTSMAIVCLMISGFCDLFDGSIARTKKQRTENEQKFGIQIDSLADMICFGILPVAIGFSIGLTKWYEAAALVAYEWARAARRLVRSAGEGTGRDATRVPPPRLVRWGLCGATRWR